MAILRKKKKGSLQEIGDSQSRMGAEEVMRLAKKKGFYDDYLDIRSFVRSLGISLQLKPLENEISGYLIESFGDWEIVVNSLHHPRRQRFTIAHELGHYFLHKGQQKKFIDRKLFRNGDSNSIETEANQFAAAILMPEQQFRSYISSESKKVEDIAEHFGVSAASVQIRALNLGYTQ